MHLRSTLFLILISSGFAVAQDSSAVQTAAPSATPTNQQADNPPVKKKAKRVFTNDDVKAADPKDIPAMQPDSTVDSGTPAATTAASATAGKEDKNKKAGKPAKAATAEQISAAQAKVDSLKKEEAGESAVVADIQRLISEQPGRADGMGPGLAKNQSDLADTRKKLADAQQQLDALKNQK